MARAHVHDNATFGMQKIRTSYLLTLADAAFIPFCVKRCRHANSSPRPIHIHSDTIATAAVVLAGAGASRLAWDVVQMACGSVGLSLGPVITSGMSGLAVQTAVKAAATLGVCWMSTRPFSGKMESLKLFRHAVAHRIFAVYGF